MLAGVSAGEDRSECIAFLCTALLMQLRRCVRIRCRRDGISRRSVPLPNLDAAVFAARGEPTATRIKFDGVNRARIGSQCLYFFAVGHIPDANGFVPTARCQPSTIGAERNTADGGLMTVERPDVLARVGIPQANRFISTGGSEVFGVRAECNGVDDFLVPGDRCSWRAGCDVPDLDGFFVVAGGDEFAIRAERDVNDRPARPTEVANF